jgi:hypothetical protein
MVQNFQSVETNAITAADTRVQTVVSKNLLLEKLTSYMGSDQSPLLVPVFFSKNYERDMRQSGISSYSRCMDE